jgi:Transglutaminase-like superfamily
MSSEGPTSPASPGAPGTSPRRKPTAAALAVAVAGAVILADAAVETFAAGAGARWSALVALAAYVAVTAATFRAGIGWRTRVTIALLAVVGLVAASAWLPDGLAAGVRLVGQPTPRVLSGLTAGAIVVAVIVLIRATAVPLVVRLVAALVAVYGLTAFALGAWQSTAYGALFAGDSVWRALPRVLQGAFLGGLVAVPLALVVSLAGGLARGTRRWQAQPIVALASILALAVSGFVNGAPGAGGGIRRDLSTAGVGAPSSASEALPIPDDRTTSDAVAFLKKISAAPEPSTFDVDRKAAELGNDPAALFAYVHDHVRTEIYSGVLRGARGTLMGGAGNAWDQALLLAAMLKHHGRDVRFAHARLAPADAAPIVARMFADAARPRPAPSSVAIPAALQQQSRALLQRVRSTSQQSYADMLDALKQGGLTLGTRAVSRDMLATEAADHVWVEYRDSDRWIPLDPTAADRPGVAVTAATDTFAQVPDAQYHHVTIRVTAEERHGQQLETKDVLRYQTTADALHGTRVLLWHYFDHDVAARWRARPLLAIGNQVYGAMKIGEAGVVSVASTKADLIAQAHQAVGKDQLGQVADLFKSGPSTPAASSAGELTAERLEIDFTDPSGHVETVQRDLFDRIGAGPRVAATAATAALSPMPEVGNIPVQLETIYACAFTAGPLDPSSVLRPLAEHTAVLDAAAALRRRASGGAADPQESKLVQDAMQGVATVLAASAATAQLMSQRLAPQLESSGRMIFYEATPRLVIASAAFAASADGRRMTPSFDIDLRRDTVRVVGSDDPVALVRANSARGVLDAVIEDALLPEPSLAGAVSTVGVMRRARAADVPLVSLRDPSGVRALGLSGQAQARMTTDARNGLALVTTAKPVQMGDAPRAVWWRIDLSTGETVGMIDTGLHGKQVTEDAALADTVELPAARAISPLATTMPPVPPITVLDTGATCTGITEEMIRTWDMIVYAMFGP